MGRCALVGGSALPDIDRDVLAPQGQSSGKGPLGLHGEDLGGSGRVRPVNSTEEKGKMMALQANQEKVIYKSKY